METLVWIYHQPKCGGTSLRYSLLNALSPEKLVIFYEHLLENRTPELDPGTDLCNGNPLIGLGSGWRDPQKWASRKQIRCVSDEDWFHHDHVCWTHVRDKRPEARVLYGHRVPHPKHFQAFRETRTVIMLRDPLERIASLYDHIGRNHFMRRMNNPNYVHNFDDFKAMLQGGWVCQDFRAYGLQESLELVENADGVFFYDNYLGALAGISEIVGTELKPEHQNIWPRAFPRTPETDELVKKYCQDEIKIFEHAENLWR